VVKVIKAAVKIGEGEEKRRGGSLIGTGRATLQGEVKDK